MGYGFLYGEDGNKSNSRLIADIIVLWALVFGTALIVIKVINPAINIMDIALAVGTVFASVGGTAMTFLFFQKKTEAKDNELTKMNQPLGGI